MSNQPQFRIGDRVRLRREKHRKATILTTSLIHGDHYHVRMDEGYETLLVAAEIEHDIPVPDPGMLRAIENQDVSSILHNAEESK